MRRTTAGVALSIAAGMIALASPLSVAAQQSEKQPRSAGAFGERIEVELVNVDVWVADSDGQAVTGLGPDAFEILHDDQPVVISHFSEVSSGATIAARAGERTLPAAPGAALDGPAAAPSGHVVVYFDQSRLHPSNYPPLIRGLEELLGAESVEPERVLVIRQDRSLFVEAPFGSSRKELEATLERLSKGSPSGAELEAETDQALEAIRRTWEQNQDTASTISAGIAALPEATPGGGPTSAPSGGPRATVGGVGTGGGPDTCGSFIGQIQPVLASWARSKGARTGETLKNLSDLVGFLAGLPGIKTLVYLSDGLDTNPGAALASYATGFCPSSAAQLLSSARFEEMTPRFLELTRHANSNRVTVYALQATGLRSPRTSSAASGRRARGGEARSGGSFEASQRAIDRRGLELVAGETGGRAVFNQNEFGRELRAIARESRTYYALAYEPPADGDGQEHRIEVRLRNDSLTARYRRGYLEKDSTRWLTERIEGALNLGITDNPLGVRLGAGATVSAGEGTHRLALHVNVPIDRLVLVPQEGSSTAELVVRVMARNLESLSLLVRDKTFRLKVPAGATGFADLAIELELAESAYLTAIGVQDLGSGEASFVSTMLQVGPGG